MSNTPRWEFGLLEDNHFGGCRLDPKKIEARTFPVDFWTRNFLVRGEPLCRHSIDCFFVFGSYLYNKVSSMVTNRDRKSFGLHRYPLTRIKNVKGASRLSNFWNFLGAIQIISCRD